MAASRQSPTIPSATERLPVTRFSTSCSFARCTNDDFSLLIKTDFRTGPSSHGGLLNIIGVPVLIGTVAVGITALVIGVQLARFKRRRHLLQHGEMAVARVVTISQTGTAREKRLYGGRL